MSLASSGVAASCSASSGGTSTTGSGSSGGSSNGGVHHLSTVAGGGGGVTDDLLEGEVRTLRELGVGDGTALVVRIGPPLTQREKAAAASASGLGGGLSGGGGASSSSLLASSSSASDGYGVGGVAGLGGSSSSLLVKHAALPGVMLAHSNAYMTALFDVLRAFARCPSVIAQAWDIIMRVPTSTDRLAALARPDHVSWEAEMALEATQPMRLLYSLQVVRAWLLPSYLPEPHAPAIAAIAQWKARFMATGFRPLFAAFVRLGASRPRDTLHATLLATSLAFVRASLVGYLHVKRPLTGAAAAAAAAARGFMGPRLSFAPASPSLAGGDGPVTSGGLPELLIAPSAIAAPPLSHLLRRQRWGCRRGRRAGRR